MGAADRQLLLSSTSRFILLVVVLITTTTFSVVHAFAPSGLVGLGASSVQQRSSSSMIATTPVVRSTTTRVWMSEGGDEKEEEEEKAPEAAADEEGDVTASEDGEGDETETEDNEPKEDPEVTELKSEIASLESTLKSKRNTLEYTKESVEQYSKGGYARKVAEMENMRRVRSTMNSSGRSNAMATVLQEFLPLYDSMNELKTKYEGDDFGSKYSGLTMTPTFTQMGVSEYTVNVGDTIDPYRMSVLESKYSTDHAKNTVIEPVAMGLELDGNVIRPAECIGSLGEEVEEEEEEVAADEAVANDDEEVETDEEESTEEEEK